MPNKTKEANQRLVNEAYAHLKKTKKKSVSQLSDTGNICCYSGSGCAFSPALKDAKSCALGVSASEIVIYNSSLLHNWAKDCNPIFADDIQDCHDRCNNQEGDAFFKEFSSNLYELCTTEDYDFPKD